MTDFCSNGRNQRFSYGLGQDDFKLEKILFSFIYERIMITLHEHQKLLMEILSLDEQTFRIVRASPPAEQNHFPHNKRKLKCVVRKICQNNFLL